MTQMEILELAHWGASCLQDDYYQVLHPTPAQLCGLAPYHSLTSKERKEAEAGYQRCQEKMDWLMEEIIKLERAQRRFA